MEQAGVKMIGHESSSYVKLMGGTKRKIACLLPAELCLVTTMQIAYKIKISL